MENNKGENLIRQIQSGEVKMLPKSYFVAKSALFLLGLVLLMALTVFFVSYVVFHLQVSGAWNLSGFGILGLRDMALSLPWLILCLIAVFTVLLLWFVERYPLVYQRPLLYSLGGMALVVLVGGYLVSITPLHSYFLKTFGPEKSPVVMRGLYSPVKAPIFKNGIIGRVEKIEKEAILVKALQEKKCHVYLSKSTRMPAEFLPKEGDWIMVHGRVEGSEVEAWGIRPIGKPKVLPEGF